MPTPSEHKTFRLTYSNMSGRLDGRLYYESNLSSSEVSSMLVRLCCISRNCSKRMKKGDRYIFQDNVVRPGMAE